MTDHQHPAADSGTSHLAELRSLRDMVQTQHAVIETLTRTLKESRSATAPVRELRDALPVHASRRSEDAVQRLHRGAHEEKVDRLAERLPSGAPWWPTAASAKLPLRPSPGFAFYNRRGAAKAVGFSVVGMPLAAVEQAIDFVARSQLQDVSFVPVFLTDLTDLEPFRRRGYVAEYLSFETAPGASADGKQSFIEARKDLIRRKWNLVRVMDLQSMAEGGPAETGHDTLAEEERGSEYVPSIAVEAAADSDDDPPGAL